MRSALAGVHCDQREDRVSIAVLCCASAALVADGQGVPAGATVRNVGAREHARQLGTTLGRTTLTLSLIHISEPTRPY